MRNWIGCLLLCSIAAVTGLTAGCATPYQTAALGIVGGTSYLARTPHNEIEQIYYLGSFDPQEQIPPTIYRVRVHGQASIGRTKFASGWVKASLIDSLGTTVSFSGSDGVIKVNQNTLQGDELMNVGSDRRFVVFGPEGVRPVPKDHRLVIVMGSNPEAFFHAMDSSLGFVVKAGKQASAESIGRKMSTALTFLSDEDSRLKALAEDIASDLSGDSKGGTP